MNLFINYFEHPDPERAAEMEYCLNKNRDSKLFDRIIFMDDRPTFNQLFEFINEQCSPGDIAIIANSDIYFNDTINIARGIKENEVYCLSRWDKQPDGSISLFNRADSQDVWIFRAPMKKLDAGFCLGKPGCDNRIAHEFEQAGYVVINPSKSIITVHVHASNARPAYAPSDIIPKPYKLIAPSFL